ncbi:MAG: D-serine ammonia-lyase [Desulfitobacterium sp.]
MRKQGPGTKDFDLLCHIPIMQDLMAARETFWINPQYGTAQNNRSRQAMMSAKGILAAEKRLQRFAPYLARVFPETRANGGLIESSLVPIENMQRYLESRFDVQIRGNLWLKCDSHLPISGSIKARGGIYEVLKLAEELTLKEGLLTTENDYSILADPSFREFFSTHTIAVGSTGNLGLSIGVMGSKLGFKVTVHMSADAKEWKKERLRSEGVEVIEYAFDYSKAVEEGRKQAKEDPCCHFVDDESSKDLFLGYAVAGRRLKHQLEELNLWVDSNHPLFVYLPCGVGGGPGGIAFGLKEAFGENVHCFFAEPTHSPCMLLGLATGRHDQIAVQDIGLDNKTEADGLAVGRASRFVGKLMEDLLSGAYTIQDDELFCLLQALHDTQGIQCEPSALAGMAGPARLLQSTEGMQYLKDHHLEDKLKKATHIIWATGGNLVPEEVMRGYLMRGK